MQASPVARRLAEELGLDLSQIQGTGPEGRVVRADIEAAQAQGLARPPMPAGAVPSTQSEFTPPPADTPQPPIPAVEPAPEPEAPSEPAAEAEPAPATGDAEPEQPAVDAAPEPEPEPEPTVTEPEPTLPEPEPEPEPELTAEPEPEPDAPADEPGDEAEPEITPEPATEEPDVPAPPAADAAPAEPHREQVILPAAQPGGGRASRRSSSSPRQGQTIARRMAESKATIPHFAVRAEVDAAPILGLRTDLAATRPDLAPPSVNDLVLRAAALALRANPALNGAYRDGRLERYPRINIGIPVDVEDGLPVPVIQDATA